MAVVICVDPANEHVLREESVVERLEWLAIVDKVNAFEILKLGKVKGRRRVVRQTLLKLGHAFLVARCG